MPEVEVNITAEEFDDDGVHIDPRSDDYAIRMCGLTLTMTVEQLEGLYREMRNWFVEPPKEKAPPTTKAKSPTKFDPSKGMLRTL